MKTKTLVFGFLILAATIVHAETKSTSESNMVWCDACHAWVSNQEEKSGTTGGDVGIVPAANSADAVNAGTKNLDK